MQNKFLQPINIFSPLFFVRTLFKPPTNIPYFGIYRTNGEICKKDDLLVYQKNMNYHPGANVRWHSFNGRHMLKSNCDGTVLITREHCNPDPNIKMMEDLYSFRNYENIYKLTFNVIPRKMSNKFLLLDEE